MQKLVYTLAAFAALTTAQAHAQTVVTVNGDGARVSGPAADQPLLSNDTWALRNVRAGTTVGVTSDYARSGNGSVVFSGADGTAKADLELLFATPFRLSQLSGLQYDWYRSSKSTVAEHLAPALRLYVAAATEAGVKTGYLIYEPVYNGLSALTEDAWQTTSIGASTNLWLRQFGGLGTEEVFDRTLAAYQAGYAPTGSFAEFDGSAFVYGLSFGVGSGWSGTHEMAVDNVRFTTSEGRDVQYNFEVTTAAVPEPSTYLLVATGLAALGLLRRRRRAIG